MKKLKKIYLLLFSLSFLFFLSGIFCFGISAINTPFVSVMTDNIPSVNPNRSEAYTIKFYVDGELKTSSYVHANNVVIEPKIDSQSGHYLVKWAFEPNRNTQITLGSKTAQDVSDKAQELGKDYLESISLYATYISSDPIYNFNYFVDGEFYASDNHSFYDDTSPVTATKTGYYADEWHFNESLTSYASFGEKVSEYITDLTQTQINFYSAWKVNSYTVHFSSETDSTDVKKSSTYTAQNNIATLSELGISKSGYKFLGWKVVEYNQTFQSISNYGKVFQDSNTKTLNSTIQELLDLNLLEDGGAVIKICDGIGNGGNIYLSAVWVDTWLNHMEMPSLSESWDGDQLISSYHDISSAGNLAWLCNLINSGDGSVMNYTFRFSDEIDLSKYLWTPIGTQENPFKNGMFINDSSCKITNMLILSENEDYVGLFGYATEVLPLFTISDSYVKGGNYTGLVCGFSKASRQRGSDISNSVVIGKECVGGAFGFCQEAGTDFEINVSNCEIKGEKKVGGVCGLYYTGATYLPERAGTGNLNYLDYALKGKVYNSTIEATEDGSLGGAFGTITNRISDPTIPTTITKVDGYSGYDQYGVAYVNYDIISSKIYYSGTSTAESAGNTTSYFLPIGGVCGYAHCYSTSLYGVADFNCIITAVDIQSVYGGNMGGIVGGSYGATMTGNSAQFTSKLISGTISSDSYSNIGGFAGHITSLSSSNELACSRVANLGVNLKAQSGCAGGIVGYLHGGTVSECYVGNCSFGPYNSNAYLGGIVGISNGETKILSCIVNNIVVDTLTSSNRSATLGVIRTGNLTIKDCYLKSTGTTQLANKYNASQEITAEGTLFICRYYSSDSWTKTKKGTDFSNWMYIEGWDAPLPVTNGYSAGAIIGGTNYDMASVVDAWLNASTQDWWKNI